MSESRKCLFCESPAASREHIIAEWLTKRMSVRDVEFQPTRFRETDGFLKFPKTKSKYFETKQVCEKCNNEWMSELETWFQKNLGALVEKKWPEESRDLVKTLRAKYETLIRWMVKTAIVFEKATPKGEAVIPISMRSFAKDGGNVSDFVLLVGHIQAPRFSAFLMKGFPVYTGSELINYLVHDESFTFGVCFNHLALRLVRCPNATALIKQQKNSNGDIIVPFQIFPPNDYPEKVLHTFPTFELFWDSFAAHTFQNSIR
jgi:hypothetical protein